MTLRQLLCAVMALMLGFPGLTARAQTEPIKAALMNMPSTIAPLLTDNGKLDMIDYYESDMDHPTANIVDGHMRILDMTPDHAALELGTALKMDIYLLPAGADTVAMYVSTYLVPSADGYITVVAKDSIDITDRVFDSPEFSRWLSAAGKKRRKHVQTLLPYISTAYSYSPSTGILTLTPGYPATLSNEAKKELEPMLLPELRYQWNGKKFKALK